MSATSPYQEMMAANLFQHEVGEWANATFPQSETTSINAHFQEEAVELDYALGSRSNDEVKEEAADCLLLLLHLSHKMGFSLFAAAMEKFEVNKARQWEAEAGVKGYWKHR